MRTITVETALEEIRREIAGADGKHGIDGELMGLVAAAYTVLCAGEDEVVSVVAGDKTASEWYRDGRPLED